jgi:hypothetical protein
MSVERSPRHRVPYHFVGYDADGGERPGPAGVDLLTAATGGRHTDVFVFSHGWNTGRADAIAQYGRWLDVMADRTADLERLRAAPGGFRPLLVGLHWPSKAWSDEGAGGGASFAVAATPGKGGAAGDPVERLVAEYAGDLDAGPGATDAIRTIVESAMWDAAPPTLPGDVRAAYARLDADAGPGRDGVGAAPGDDRDRFDPEETYQAALQMDIADPVDFGRTTLGGVLAPLRVLSFWTMKRRARRFGETGAAQLLRRLQAAAPTARCHLMGHSFGCIVAAAAIRGAPGAPGPRRPVDTLLLAQGAMSLWSFCDDIPARPGRAGYFHDLVRARLVRGPAMATMSAHDRAVRLFYPLGAGVRVEVAFGDLGPKSLPVYGGLGAFGARGPGIEIHDADIRQVDESFDLRPGAFYNLNADAVIAAATGIAGAHGDIGRPEVARALWRAVQMTVESGGR